MTVRSIAEYLGGHPFFTVLDTASVQELAGCARNEHIRAGQYLFREGGKADHFYVIMHGRVALELRGPAGGPLVVETVSNGEVLDWPWLIPPHQWPFDARAAEPTSVVSLESACLRAKCDADPRLGYELIQRVAQIMSDRLLATRLRLLDLYGAHGPATSDLAGERATQSRRHA
jgi:CRP/FNR family transcriptional regulator, cyclic AMP receptor protein